MGVFVRQRVVAGRNLAVEQQRVLVPDRRERQTEEAHAAANDVAAVEDFRGWLRGKVLGEGVGRGVPLG